MSRLRKGVYHLVMKIHLAGAAGFHWIEEGFFDFYRLLSFYDMTTKEKPYISKYKSFMLDSGAFTFMSNSKKTTNWDEYTERYAAFILKNNIKLFIELDIDVIVGLREVERLRHKLENLVGRQCIPVWHKSRGKQYWIDMCRDYNYVSIGGIVTGEINSKFFNHFPWFIDIAHSNKAQIHALGYTDIRGVKKYHFDSVDSTSWIYGNKFGYLYFFNGSALKILKKNHPGKRLHSQMALINNFKEWVKFARYMENR